MTFLRRPPPQSSVLLAWALWCHCGQALYIHKLATITDLCVLSFSILLYVTKFLIASKYFQEMLYVRGSYRIGNRILSRLYLHNCQRSAGRPCTVNLLLHKVTYVSIENYLTLCYLHRYLYYLSWKFPVEVNMNGPCKDKITLLLSASLSLGTGIKIWPRRWKPGDSQVGFPFLIFPYAKGVQHKEPDPVCRHFPHPPYVLWKTPVTGWI